MTLVKTGVWGYVASNWCSTLW